jgi:hypothetical protein
MRDLAVSEIMLYRSRILAIIRHDVGNSGDCAWGNHDGDGYLDLFVASFDEGNQMAGPPQI